MDRRNIGRANFVLDEVTRTIIATLEPFGLDWDYATYVSFKDDSHEYGEFFLFHKKHPVNVKSQALLKSLYVLFQDYKYMLQPDTDTSKMTVKYVIRSLDLRVDTKTDLVNVMRWSSQNADSPSNPFNLLISETFK
jgi:hypothetical protein